MLGHAENFCETRFNSPEKANVLTYGPVLRASNRPRVQPIGEKWLRQGPLNLSAGTSPATQVEGGKQGV